MWRARRAHLGGVCRARQRQHVLLHAAARGARMKRRRLFGVGGALAALTVVPGCGGSRLGDNVAPALRALTLVNPLALVPVIVEMHPAPGAGSNVALAAQALDLLRVYGVPVAGLPLINAAAGFANAAAIDTL